MKELQFDLDLWKPEEIEQAKAQIRDIQYLSRYPRELAKLRTALAKLRTDGLSTRLARIYDALRSKHSGSRWF
jgi:hypothetical protein